MNPVAIPPPGQVQRWTKCVGSASTYTLANLVSRERRFCVFVANDSDNAYRLMHEIQFFAPDVPQFVLPDPETLPYDTMSPPANLVSDRISCLYELPNIRFGILVLPIRTLMQKLPPRDYIQGRSFHIKVGDRFDPIGKRNELIRAGYRSASTVYERGEFAIRGNVVDIYAYGLDVPVRVDLFDDIVESLRYFNVDTQRTEERTEEIAYQPVYEFPFDEAGISTFRSNWHQRFHGDIRRCTTYQEVSKGKYPEGLECYFPLFFNNINTIFDYLPEDVVFAFDTNFKSSADAYEAEIRSRYTDLRLDESRPLLPPQQLFLSLEEIQMHTKAFSRIEILEGSTATRHTIDFDLQRLPDLTINHRAHDPIASLRDFCEKSSKRMLLVVETAGRREFVQEFLARHQLQLKAFNSLREFLSHSHEFGLIVAGIDRLCELPDTFIITEMELFATHSSATVIRNRTKTIDPDLLIRNLAEIEIGSPVVHLTHGIARYQGLEVIRSGTVESECVILEFDRGDRVLVPVTNLDVISRYVGASGETIPLNRLGGSSWGKAKTRAIQRIRDIAAELMSLYANRELVQRRNYREPSDEFHTFCDRCSFELTLDQQQATRDVLDDLINPRPMDRLVCGDVGFGKTEIAMRAAFHVASQGRQVAVLVPTTLLVQQHYDTFLDRFANEALSIEFISRLRTQTERRLIEKKLQDGTLDIVIGTHHLLSKRIGFKDLGLLIIDEEHRFGVRQKETIRKLKTDVDTLALSATPIPRTLNMALEGVRQLSVISTPPANRLPIKTIVTEYNDALIADAINREIDRGGQVYYLYNRVETIHSVAENLASLLPSAKINVAHGQMPKQALSSRMRSFYHREFNVLVCTTIIESGIDIPNANTIIIHRSDEFGIAQLHQIRGRVGRSFKQAYAYMLIPGETMMTADSKKRLEAISSADELGAGFTLAMHDLEIRGAGELLGQEQSGVIEGIGYGLYIQMLNRAVKDLQQNHELDLEQYFETEAEVDFHQPTLIPAYYVDDVSLRLVLYRQIASKTTNLELDRLQEEFIDRFGPMPGAVVNLFRVARIKLRAANAGIGAIKVDKERATLELVDPSKFDTSLILQLVQQKPDKYSLKGEQQLKVDFSKESDQDRFTAVEKLLVRLTASDVRTELAA